MRIRSIKPEFWRSDDITVLGWEDRLIFIGLWSYVDDNGVGMDKLAAIAADLFAGDLERDSSETFARVSRGLQNLSEASRITRYKVAGKAYLHITNWDKHQRIDKPNKARYPVPTCDDAQTTHEFATPSRESRETPATGTEEQGNRGTGEKRKYSPPTLSDDFIDFYMDYPRKEARAAAVKAYDKALTKASPDVILAGCRRYAADPNREQAFTKLPASWLNGECWDDDPLPARGAPPTRADQNLAKGAQLFQHFQQLENNQRQIGA